MKQYTTDTLIILMTGIIFIMTSCDKNDGNELIDDYFYATKENEVPPNVSTKEQVFNIFNDSATAEGIVISNGGAPVTARGFVWSKYSNPTLLDNHSKNGSGLGNFSSVLSDLESETRYYVRAYATNEYGTNYGNQINFMSAKHINNATVLFWKAQNLSEIHVSLNGELMGSITASYPSYTPDCGAQGCLTISNLKPGKYSLKAYNSEYTWEGEITLVSGCNKFQFLVTKYLTKNIEVNQLISTK